MKKLSFLLVVLALFCFISLNSCKQKAAEAETTEETVVEEEMVEEPAEADTVAAEVEAEEETME